jgi:hypothetical protein
MSETFSKPPSSRNLPDYKSYLSKPMTPKRLLLFTQPSTSGLKDLHLNPNPQGQNTMLKLQRPQTTKNQHSAIVGTANIPEFAREYVLGLSDSRQPGVFPIHSARIVSKDSFTKLNTPRPNSSAPGKIRKPQPKPKLKPETFMHKCTLNDILNAYHPQILNFDDKSKIKVFTTVSKAVKRSKARLQRTMELLNRKYQKRKKVGGDMAEESEEKVYEIEHPYNKPAITFGEKLWRLNEMSVLQIK